MIVRGSAVAAAAWTAPTLLASSAAAVGQSTCKSGETYCTNGSFDSAKCCPTGTTCNPTDGPGGTPVCLTNNSAGGTCGNSGQGVCSDQTKCNSNKNSKGCNLCRYPNTCGGEGSPCSSSTDCFGSPTYATCTSIGAERTNASFCRRKCGAGCSSGQVCDTSGFCAVACTTDSQCQNGNGTCKGGFCTYAV